MTEAWLSHTPGTFLKPCYLAMKLELGRSCREYVRTCCHLPKSPCRSECESENAMDRSLRYKIFYALDRLDQTLLSPSFRHASELMVIYVVVRSGMQVSATTWLNVSADSARSS